MNENATTTDKPQQKNESKTKKKAKRKYELSSNSEIGFNIHELEQIITYLLNKVCALTKTNVLLLHYFSYSQISEKNIIFLYKKLKTLPFDKNENLSIILTSNGGDINAAYQCANFVQEYIPGKIDLFIPFRAMSASTFFSLASDRVIFNNFSKIGPLDPQIISTNSLIYGDDNPNSQQLPLKAISTMPDYFFNKIISLNCDNEIRKIIANSIINKFIERVNPFFLSQYNNIEELVIQYAKKLLFQKGFNEDQINKCVKQLISYPVHSYCIDYEEISNSKTLNSIINAVLIDSIENGPEINELLMNLLEMLFVFEMKTSIQRNQAMVNPYIEAVSYYENQK